MVILCIGLKFSNPCNENGALTIQGRIHVFWTRKIIIYDGVQMPYCCILTRLVTAERLRGFGDSVLLVAITLMAYNLAPPVVINGQAHGQNFFNNLYGLITSFFVIFTFWFIYLKILLCS